MAPEIHFSNSPIVGENLTAQCVNRPRDNKQKWYESDQELSEPLQKWVRRLGVSSDSGKQNEEVENQTERNGRVS